MSSRPATLGQLRESGWESIPVKEEVRRNAVRKIAAGEPVFERVLGYENTVFPQLENALLAGHDIIFLGERGQAKIRLPLDVLLVASANPDDYTNRGRIISPLKDRFGSQIRTHYPLEVATEVAIMRQEARPPSVGDVHVTMPDYMEEIVATFSHLARQSSHVNQRSGVSVRLSVSNSEVLAANAMRRALRTGERAVVPRVCDLEALAPSTSGKIEIETLEEGREGQIVENMLKAAVLTVYKE